MKTMQDSKLNGSSASPLFEIDRVSQFPCNLPNYRLPIVPVPPVMGLDLSVTPPPPPLTSFTGSKSRIPRSRILPFLTRCQTERTTLIFGDRSSIDNYFVSTFAPGGSTDTLLAR